MDDGRTIASGGPEDWQRQPGQPAGGPPWPGQQPYQGQQPNQGQQPYQGQQRYQGQPPGAYPPGAQGPAPWYPSPNPAGTGVPGKATGRAKVALVLAIVGLVVGLIPSIIALVLSRSVRKDPAVTTGSRSRARAAKIIGIIGLVTSIAATAIIIAVVYAAVTTKSFSSLNAGQCFNNVDAGNNTIYGVQPVSCSSPHEALATGRVVLPAGAYPSDSDFNDIIDNRCTQFAAAYLPNGPGANTKISALLPSTDDWSNGKRVILCILRTADGSRTTSSFDAGS